MILFVISAYVLIFLSELLKRIAAAFLCPTVHELHISRRSASVVNSNVTWIVNELKKEERIRINKKHMKK
jgi:hypothetical protein